MKKITIFLFIFINIIPISKIRAADHVTIIHWQTNGNFAIEYLKKKKIPITVEKNGVIKIYKSEKVVSGLIDLTRVLQKKIEIIAENLANFNTTRTIAMDTKIEPYRRQILKLGEKGEVIITKDKSPFRLKYDPKHPDAIKSGDKKGYVQWPNINIVTEMVDMIGADNLYNQIRQI